MKHRHLPDDTPATPHFDFLYGRYHLSSAWTIPYFSTTIPLDHVAEHLKLAVDFPGSDQLRWRLDELYQREVDWPRVERSIVPYLRASDQPQFFNALTIALLPMDEGASSVPYTFDNSVTWKPPTLDHSDQFGKLLNVGPISCGFWFEWASFGQAEARTGQLRWNPKQVFAVALDGQHRLAAIKRFVHTATSTSMLSETTVPVILLVLAKEFGYVDNGSVQVVDVLRKVFIDLNKHAKVPTRARQILLDDKDPTSVCVRALVGEALCDGTAELEGNPPRLPLSLVDWHTEQAKFDEGPYVTTILVVDWAIATLLGAKPIQDFTDYGAVRSQLKALENYLEISLTAAKERLENLASAELRPFNYADDANDSELSRISEAFGATWNRAFVRLLTEFGPYRHLIQRRKEMRTFSLDFANWYRLWHQSKRDRYQGRATEEYNQFLYRLDGREEPSGPTGRKALERTLEEIGALKAQNLAFNVAFQRSYFLAFRELLMVKDWDLEELDELAVDDAGQEGGELEAGNVDEVDGEDGQVGELAERVGARSQQFVDYLNAFVEKCPGILDPNCLWGETDGVLDRLWLGTLLKPDGGIDFTQGASTRALDILYWVVAMQMYDDIVDPLEHSDFEDFWNTIWEEDNSFTKRLLRSVKRFSDRERGAGDRILSARGEDFDLEASREEAKRRMRWIWKELEL